MATSQHPYVGPKLMLEKLTTHFPLLQIQVGEANFVLLISSPILEKVLLQFQLQPTNLGNWTIQGNKITIIFPYNNYLKVKFLLHLFKCKTTVSKKEDK